MRYRPSILLLLALGLSQPAGAQLGIGFSSPGVSIGVNLPVYPDLVPVPGYPVYYGPSLDANYFFYDGMYWVYAGDSWYTSAWYNGPWSLVDPYAVPLFLLRVPVIYYRRPPPFFHGWRRDAPPRWDEHYGRDWAGRHGGWDHWDRRAVPAAAPLPTYQRQFSHGQYPSAQQQRELQSRNYRYQPHDATVRQQMRAPAVAATAAPPAAQREAAHPAVPPAVEAQRSQAEAARRQADAQRGQAEAQRGQTGAQRSQTEAARRQADAQRGQAEVARRQADVQHQLDQRAHAAPPPRAEAPPPAPRAEQAQRVMPPPREQQAARPPERAEANRGQEHAKDGEAGKGDDRDKR